MTSKHQVIEAHRSHPEWTGTEIARALGCRPGFVFNCIKGAGLALSRKGKSGPKTAQPQVCFCECGDHAWTPLTSGYVALLDGEDSGLLSNRTWHANRRGHHLHVRGTEHGKCGKTVLLHREIMKPSTSEYVDHKDGNGLDNRRRNLRRATPQQNTWNRRVFVPSQTSFIGVCRVGARFKAVIMDRKRSIYLGCFKEAEHAARVYDAAAILLRGEFAVLNFPELANKPLSEVADTLPVAAGEAIRARLRDETKWKDRAHASRDSARFAELCSSSQRKTLQI